MKTFYNPEQTLELASLYAELKNDDSFGEKAIGLYNSEKLEELLALFTSNSELLLKLGDSEFEPVYNLLIAFASQFPESISVNVSSIIGPIVADDQDRCSLKLKVLSNLYNYVAEPSEKFKIYGALVKVASQHSEVATLNLTLEGAKNLVLEWGISPEETRDFYQLLSETQEYFLIYDRTSLSYQFVVESLKLHEQAPELATRGIKIALCSPSTFLFEELCQLSAVQALKPSLLFDLLDIFKQQTLKEYKAFIKSHPQILKENELNDQELIRKIRLLTFASYATKNISKEVTYESISKMIDVTVDQVEFWIIDCIRAGLLDARIDQLNQSVYINRASYRVFGIEQWKEIKAKVDAWQTNLNACLNIIGKV
ncbi:hypothetical protein HDV01_000786 [Terramyces sp. JEL0728]|nr:hypothetical protein HDV01_000786 [Terramyces sp. JEL0728]